MGLDKTLVIYVFFIFLEWTAKSHGKIAYKPKTRATEFKSSEAKFERSEEELERSRPILLKPFSISEESSNSQLESSNIGGQYSKPFSRGAQSSNSPHESSKAHGQSLQSHFPKSSKVQTLMLKVRTLRAKVLKFTTKDSSSNSSFKSSNVHPSPAKPKLFSI